MQLRRLFDTTPLRTHWVKNWRQSVAAAFFSSFTKKMDVLYLRPALLSKKEGLTPQEEHLLRESSLQATRGLFAGLGIGSLAGWLATKRLHVIPRIAVSAVAAAASGSLILQKSLESSLEYFLSLQGTRIQGELAHIILKRNQNDPWVHRCIYKYFYPEVVYNDSSVDKPVYRWRYRNTFGDPVTPQSTSNSEETNSKENDINMTTVEIKQARVNVNAGEHGDAVESPFHLVLGNPESAADGPQADNAPKTMSRRQARKEKRLRRRHRQHQDEESEF